MVCKKKEPAKDDVPKILKAKAFFGDRELLSNQGDDVYVSGKGGAHHVHEDIAP